MSAPTPAPGDDRPREGYYPDPSIPGYVRYWNGASWVPGTSRPAPKDGEPLIPPPGIRPAAPAVEETGPHFFDEDPPAAGTRAAESGPAADTGRQDPAGARPGQWAQGAQAAQADQWTRAGESDQAGPVGQWARTGQTGPGGQAGQWGAVDQAGQSGQAGQGGQAGPWAQAGQGGQAGEGNPAGRDGQAVPGGPAAQGDVVAQAGQAAQWSQSAPSPHSGRPGQSGHPGRLGQPDQPGQLGPDAQPGQLGTPAQPGATGQSSTPGLPGTPAQSGAPAQPGVPGQSGVPAQSGAPAQPGVSAQPATPGLPGQRDRSGGFGGDAGRGGAWGADPRVPMDSPAGSGGQGAADGAATVLPSEAGDAPDPGTFVFRRPVPGPAAARTDDGTMTIRPVPADPPGPAAEGAQGPVGAPAASGFGAGKAAAQAAAAAQAPVTPQAPQPQAPHPAPAVASPVPQQSGPAPVTTPVTSGPGGGQASWAQQVHQLAGGGDEPSVAPWKPPVEDLFQAAARRQAAARPAGLGRRLAARLIDLAVVGAVTAAAAVPLGIRAVDHVQQKIDAARLSGHQVTVWLIDGTTGTGLGIVLAVLLLAGVLYEVLPTVRWGRTLGKKLCGLEVRDIEAHEPPTFGPALRRWLVFSVPGLLVVGVVGVLWCLFDRPWRQCWHDKAAHTFVAG
ncbi:RDD family protein [Streptomyces lavenduligriseus]|nr:RDD family protein [Streptomyces lavenduligriseus]